MPGHHGFYLPSLPIWPHEDLAFFRNDEVAVHIDLSLVIFDLRVVEISDLFLASQAALLTKALLSGHHPASSFRLQ
jgi:hypothetical protein